MPHLANMIYKLIIILILYLSTSSCYPSKPLNERSPDLTWEAWLLVDEQQNQNKQPSDGVLRRRITPKSVFIAPTFSPDSLPECAEGYSSDHLGRCIKIIKLDQAAHYDFLIEKLKEKFTPSDYDEDYYDEEAQTQGPFQVNIPLGDQEEVIEESDVAIIVSPTKPNRSNKRDDVQQMVEKIEDAERAEEDKEEYLLKQLTETTTIPPTTTTNTESTITTTDPTTIEPTTAATLQTMIRFPTDEETTQSLTPHVPRAINFNPPATPATPEPNNKPKDKNALYMLPPRWTDSNFQRPVFLRFSRKHAYLDMEQFKKPNYYRSIPTDDFAYLFKFKHKPNQR